VTLLQILVVLAVVAAVAAVAAGAWRRGPAHDGADTVGLPEPTTTVPPLELPADRFTADDVDGVHFSLGLRGYRMDEVDQVLDRVSAELRARDAELVFLREQAAGRVTGGGATAPTDDDADGDTDDDDTDDGDADGDSVVASTEGSVAGFGGIGTTAEDRPAAPGTKEP
jgi:DivIVA domain-containing protein